MAHQPLNILIVEDDPIIAEDLYSLLTMHDYKVAYVAHNGTDAIDALANKQPDFAILDINLGSGMTGIDVAEVIHNKYHIPYIFLSSFDDEETLNAAQSHGPYGYLVKPFQDRTLLTTIKIAQTNYESTKKTHEVSKEAIETHVNQKFTNQEFNIITLLIEGLSYRQIAEKCFISANTVKYHAGNIYSKCGISGRAELAAKLI